MKNSRSILEGIVLATVVMIKLANEKKAKSQNSTEEVDFIDVSDSQEKKQSREGYADQRAEVKIIHIPKSEKIFKY